MLNMLLSNFFGDRLTVSYFLDNFGSGFHGGRHCKLPWIELEDFDGEFFLLGHKRTLTEIRIRTSPFPNFFPTFFVIPTMF